MHMRELGFDHPDTMSSVILGTFWCKRHGKDLRVNERAMAYKRGSEAQRNAKTEAADCVQKAKAELRDCMAGLRWDRRDVPVVRMPTAGGLNIRFMCPFRDGVFVSVYFEGRRSCSGIAVDQADLDPADGKVHIKPQYDDYVNRGYYSENGKTHKAKPQDDFYVRGCYFDPHDCELHSIRVKEVNEVYSAVVVDGRAWFAGMTDGKTALVGLGDRDRITIRLPLEDEMPDLGMDGQSLLAVYSKTIYRLTNREWTRIHSGDIWLPRSGLPPLRHGNMVFFRDEGHQEIRKRLWWLAMAEPMHLHVLEHNVGTLNPDNGVSSPSVEIDDTWGPRWSEVSSYCVTKNGDLWGCVGQGYGSNSLFRRSKDGAYSIAIVNDSLRFSEDETPAWKEAQAISISGVATLSDDTLLLVGDTGLYRLRDNELVQDLAFVSAGTSDENEGIAIHHWNVNPNAVLRVDERSYLISTGSKYGLYLLHKGEDGQWTAVAANDDPEVPSLVW
jgi:hypothetical protein